MVMKFENSLPDNKILLVTNDNVNSFNLKKKTPN